MVLQCKHYTWQKVKEEGWVPDAQVFKEREEMTWGLRMMIRRVKGKHEISARLTSLPSNQGLTQCSNLFVSGTESTGSYSLRISTQGYIELYIHPRWFKDLVPLQIIFFGFLLYGCTCLFIYIYSMLKLCIFGK